MLRQAVVRTMIWCIWGMLAYSYDVTVESPLYWITLCALALTSINEWFD